MLKQCIVIGASAGGFEVLKNIITQLPKDLPTPVFVAMHVPAYHPSVLPNLLDMYGNLPALHPKDGQEVEPGCIYVAPPDHHLLIDDGHIAVKKGPKENGFRPSVDALFRSAAYTFGPGAIGVILSGALDDGTSGLWTIKRLGGTAIVQDPREAQFESMPRSALEYVEADYTVPSAEIGPLLARLSKEQTDLEMAVENQHTGDLEDRIAKEVNIAAGATIPPESILDLGELVPFTCPACQGTLVRINEGKLFRFRCHTGHGFSEDALLQEITQSVGDEIWQVTRGIQEAEMLLEHIGGHIRNSGDPDRAEKFFKKAHELKKWAARFHDFALEHEELSKDKFSKSQIY